MPFSWLDVPISSILRKNFQRRIVGYVCRVYLGATSVSIKQIRNYSGTQIIDITCDFFEDFVIP